VPVIHKFVAGRFRGAGMRSTFNVDSAQLVQESENVQEPKNDDDNDDRVQNGFDGALHRDKAIDEPEQDSDDDQDDQHLK
jgi:hypothetical protein